MADDATPPGARPGEFTLEARRTQRVAVLGAGRLGTALAAALAGAGYRDVALASRRAERAEAVAGEVPGLAAVAVEALPERDLVFFAVPDGEVGAAASAHEWRAGQAVAHCSGALGLDALAPAVERGALAGCFHPLQTFPGGEPPVEAARRFEGVTVGVEAAASLGAVLESMAADLGASSVRLEGVDRALYHAAAVLASNDIVALAAASQRTWALAGLPVEAARPALGPLLLAAASNAAALPPARALTGPVARGDAETVARHLRALEAEPELRELYRRLALELLRLDLGHSEAVRERLAALLGERSGGGA